MQISWHLDHNFQILTKVLDPEISNSHAQPPSKTMLVRPLAKWCLTLQQGFSLTNGHTAPNVA